MNFQLSKEQRDIKSAAREFAEGEIRVRCSSPMEASLIIWPSIA